MKKIFILLLLACFILVGCKSENKDKNDSSNEISSNINKEDFNNLSNVDSNIIRND